MIEFRHLCHPIRSAKSLQRRIYNRLVERRYNQLPLGQRKECWCGGELQPFRWHAGYGVCADCGCYVNRYPPLPEVLKQVYSLDLYWRRRQRMKGFLPIEARGSQYRSEGRLDYWLSLVTRYGPRQGWVIEVGCAPGVLLAELQGSGFECIGVEADGKVADWVRRNTGVDVREGLFPGPELPDCDLFLAFDVAEHTPTPLAFWKEIARLLTPGGVAILQTSVETLDYEHPFKARPDFFEPIEHLFLYTDRSIRILTALAELELVAIEEAPGTLGGVCILRKPMPHHDG